MIHAYLRVSSQEQADSGLGLQAQLTACAGWASRQPEGRIEAIHSDTVSGASDLDDRPGLLGAIAALEKGDVLLVAKRDRLARDVVLSAMLEAAVRRKGAQLVSAAGEGTESDDPASVLLRRIVDAFAEYERLLIRARTKAALRAKKERGEIVGNIPYGYRSVGGHLVEDLAEQRVMRRARELRRCGKSLRQVAAELAAEQHLARSGKPFGPSAVRAMVAPCSE